MVAVIDGCATLETDELANGIVVVGLGTVGVEGILALDDVAELLDLGCTLEDEIRELLDLDCELEYVCAELLLDFWLDSAFLLHS